MGRFWDWVRRGSSTPPHEFRCPKCGAAVVGEPGYGDGVRGQRFWTAPNDAELVARCPTHGHPPWNVPA
jgi:hypothetical protein